MLATVGLFAQEKVEDDLNFEIFCGSGAHISKGIVLFKEIVDTHDTIALRKKLFADTKLEQILTAITLTYYRGNTHLRLTRNEQQKIKEISKFKDKFSVCFTCLFYQQGTVKQLFNRKKYLESYAIIESFLSDKLLPLT